MAQPSDTFDRYDLIGVREDLSDVISNISPTDTPFMSNIGKASCDNSQFDWQTDSLAAAAANATIEGDDTAALLGGALLLESRMCVGARAPSI